MLGSVAICSYSGLALQEKTMGWMGKVAQKNEVKETFAFQDPILIKCNPIYSLKDSLPPGMRWSLGVKSLLAPDSAGDVSSPAEG